MIILALGSRDGAARRYDRPVDGRLYGTSQFLERNRGRQERIKRLAVVLRAWAERWLNWPTLIAVCGAGLICLAGAVSLGAPQQSASAAFNTTEAMVPMRDGPRLYTQIYAPVSATEPLPM